MGFLCVLAICSIVQSTNVSDWHWHHYSEAPDGDNIVACFFPTYLLHTFSLCSLEALQCPLTLLFLRVGIAYGMWRMVSHVWASTRGSLQTTPLPHSRVQRPVGMILQLQWTTQPSLICRKYLGGCGHRYSVFADMYVYPCCGMHTGCLIFNLQDEDNSQQRT